MKRSLVWLPLALLLPITGCTPWASDRSSFPDAHDSNTILLNERIELAVDAKIRQANDLFSNAHINVTCDNGIVLLTGEAADADIRNRIAKLASTTDGVKKVFNFIEVGPNSEPSVRTNDSLLSARIKAALAGIRHIPGYDATRIKVVTENSVVYLMGLVHPGGANLAIEVTRREPGVHKVVTLFEYLD